MFNVYSSLFLKSAKVEVLFFICNMTFVTHKRCSKKYVYPYSAIIYTTLMVV